jgi:alkylation response protein AidB-like acyl-CoA dehydrogenase
MTAHSPVDVNDLGALLAEGLAAGRNPDASLFQLRVLAACLAGHVPDGAFCAAAGEVGAERRDDGWLLSGRLPAALSSGGAVSQCFVLARGDAGLMSFRLPSAVSGLRLETVDSLDQLSACDIALDGVHAGGGALLLGLEADALAPALFALCAELTGAAAAALDIALERVRMRKVFGRAIGAYQALAHRLVDARIGLEAMQLALDEMVQSDRDAMGIRAVALKALCSSVAPEIVAAAQQVHGGEGFYADLPLHRHTRRVQGLSLRLGGAPHQLAELQRCLISRRRRAEN